MTTYVLTKPFTDPALNEKATWCAAMLGASVATAKLIGCSPEAVVAQAALESGWGASAIGNNVFGIKADSSWHGARQLRRTWEHLNQVDVPMDDWFRDYPTLDAGILDHFQFLKENTRYANAFDFNDSKSDQEYFDDLQADGYATAPNYAQTLGAMRETVLMMEAHMSVDGAAPPPPPPRLLLIGLHGADVQLVQSALQALGLYKGKLDGDYGPLTAGAVRTYQAGKGLTADGVVGKDTRAALGLN